MHKLRPIYCLSPHRNSRVCAAIFILLREPGEEYHIKKFRVFIHIIPTSLQDPRILFGFDAQFICIGVEKLCYFDWLQGGISE